MIDKNKIMYAQVEGGDVEESVIEDSEELDDDLEEEDEEGDDEGDLEEGEEDLGVGFGDEEDTDDEE